MRTREQEFEGVIWSITLNFLHVYHTYGVLLYLNCRIPKTHFTGQHLKLMAYYLPNSCATFTFCSSNKERNHMHDSKILCMQLLHVQKKEYSFILFYLPHIPPSSVNEWVKRSKIKGKTSHLVTHASTPPLPSSSPTRTSLTAKHPQCECW